MKKNLPVLLVLLCIFHNSLSQLVENTGKPIAEIFTDFHYNLKDTTKTTGFGLNRAHFGYTYLPGNNFSATIMVNIGSPDELPAGATPRRYAYFKEASLSWSKDKLNISFGITKTRIYDYQQKFWGKRYIADTFQSLNGYGFVADLGLAVDYRINDILKADFTLMNGKGYSQIQLDNSLKTSVGLTITPGNNWASRIYGDITRRGGLWQSTLIWFAGYKNDLITIGAEYSFKSNLDLVGGHNSWGISGTGGINILKNTELFVRYDYLTSVTVPGEITEWNYLKDGSLAIYGIQYSFTENIKLALDYQGIYPYDTGISNSEALYVNALFRF
jgi:hypothetical protein